MAAGDLEGSLNNLGWLTLIREESASSSNGLTNGESSTNNSTDSSDSTIRLNVQPGKNKTKEETNDDVTCGQDGKPNLSYAELIRRGIESSSTKRMTLNEIYQWIMDNFSYYRELEQNKMPSWKNSIRHNLSLNKHFVREQRDRGDPGKGSYWRVDHSADEKYSRPGRTRSKNGTDSGSDRCGSAQTNSSNNADTPRINPVIQRIFGDPNQQTTNNVLSPESDSTLDMTKSWASASLSSQGSLPPNFKFPDLDSSIGSAVESQLSASFRNLYEQAFHANFSASGTLIPGTFNIVPNRDGQPTMITNGQAAIEHSGQDWLLRQSLHAAGVNTNECMQPNAIELFQSIDMNQFQNMMGSMQGRDLQDLLCECRDTVQFGHNTTKDELAMSWREFLTKSIGVGAATATHQEQQQLFTDWLSKHEETNDDQASESMDTDELDTTQPYIVPSSQVTNPVLCAAADHINQTIVKKEPSDEMEDDEFDWEQLINKD